MSRICSGCKKRPIVVNDVSHANNKVKRWVYPNVHVMRFIFTSDPDKHVHRGAVCTKCIKSGNLKKVL